MADERPGRPRRRARRPGVVGLLVGALALASCAVDGNAGTGPGPGSEGPLRVYATTGYLADAAANIAPEAEVTTMVGPGGDPHTHQPSTRDIQALRGADAVLWNGLHLEAQMIGQLESLGDKQLAVGELIPATMLLGWDETDAAGNALYDPHIWNDPEIWSLAVTHVADHLGAVDPARAPDYRANGQAYVEQIQRAHDEARDLLAGIAEEDRLLITGHDAFAYFGNTYDIEVHATDYISTEAQLSAQELSGLADLIVEREVPVIFQDNQANPQAITSLREAVSSRGWQVEVSAAELYADTLGAEEGVDTYLGVFRHNARAVAEALSRPGGDEGRR
ncbi:MAG TPA: zinc ABC transporter substrate-binding protein [Actinomycetaceae bacterium]|nr:zinc ABC transporter substrate-binding protein [Actinomycetaceae bacterium]